MSCKHYSTNHAQFLFHSLRDLVCLLSLAGAFVGCALNGSVVSTRNSENARFYGGPVKASEILLGSLARPPAAATLYKALSTLYEKIKN
jgi:lipid-binding SYLF domain-containing protein